MIPIASLWLPILLSAGLVLVASFAVWTLMPYHQSDYKRVPAEDALRAALRDLPPGHYNFPHLESRAELQKPEVRRLFEEGPAGFITVLPRRLPSVRKGLAQSVVYYALAGAAVAYVLGRTLDPGASYLAVFRIAGTVAWLAYGWAAAQDAIWFGRPWSSVGKQLADAFIYALLTAGVFGWLWPR